MKLGTAVSTVLVASVLLVSLPACERQEGPAEQAGEKVDKATEKVGEQIEKAGESVQDAAKDEQK